MTFEDVQRVAFRTCFDVYRKEGTYVIGIAADKLDSSRAFPDTFNGYEQACEYMTHTVKYIDL